MVLIDGRELAKEIRENLAEKVKTFKTKPKLAVILCGDDEASKVYVKIKSKACQEVGIEYDEYVLTTSSTQEDLMKLIKKLNNDKSVNGILLQYPLPQTIDYYKAAEFIKPEKDVDGFNPVNVGWLSIGKPTFIPCTPYGIMKMFEKYNIELQGKKAVIIGRSNIVGKPMAQLLLSKNATVTTCHTKTKNIEDEVKQADIIISATGHRNMVTANMVKEGAVVIDVGVSRKEDGSLCGDVDFDNVKNVASFITPSPGGVGPMTVAMLMENTVKAYEMQNK